MSAALGAAVLCCATPVAAAEVVLRSPVFEAVVDTGKGRITRIVNRRSTEIHAVTRDNCILDLSTGPVDLSRVEFRLVSKSAGTLRFVGRSGRFEISRTYVLRPGRAYVERGLTITNTGGAAVVLGKVTDCSLRFAEPFASAVYHQDVLDKCDEGSSALTETDETVVYRTAINVFFRGKRGGVFAGLKYPYFTHNLSTSAVELGYETNYRLQAGEALALPTMFVGVYDYTGYTCRKELDWTPRIISTEQEEMDWGEVRAMQVVMKDYLPEYPTGFAGYFVWLNSWWANRDLQGRMGEKEATAFIGLLENVKQSKCLDLLGIAPVWCGWAGFISPCPEIDAIGADATFPRNEHIDRYMASARRMGVPTSGFCEPTSLARHYRKDRPDWSVQPTTSPDKRTVARCHANDEYEDWFYRLQCSAIDTYSLKSWSWDHCWVRKPMTCYATNHGHEPGNCEFQQYRNITGVIRKLRDRYPTLFLEVYWGLKEAGPWSLRGLNSLENAYENDSPAPPGYTAADDMRFQHWYNHNYRFIPTYMNLAHINIHKEKNGHLYSLLSCLSASTHASLADWEPFESDAQADEIFAQMRKWKRWASGHIEYLRDRVDLFGQPCRKDGIDGTAHIIGDRGYLFLFNPTGEARWGSVPLGTMIGLSKGTRYSFDDITGDTPKRMAVCARGSSFVFSIPAKSAMLVEVLPTTGALSETRAPARTQVQPAFCK